MMKLFRRLIKRHFICGSSVRLQKEYYWRRTQKEAKVYRNSAAQHRKSNVTKETITKLYIARLLWTFSAARAINSTFYSIILLRLETSSCTTKKKPFAYCVFLPISFFNSFGLTKCYTHVSIVHFIKLHILIKKNIFLLII